MKKLVLFFLGSSLLFGSDLSTTDFIPRVVNFIIFVSILYYILADKIRDFLKGSTEEVQKRLQEATSKLDASKKQKSNASNKVHESEKLALEIIKQAKDEGKIIAKQYSEQTKRMMSTIKKNHEEIMMLDSKKVQREVSKEILEQVIDESLDSLSQAQMIQILNQQIATSTKAAK